MAILLHTADTDALDINSLYIPRDEGKDQDMSKLSTESAGHTAGLRLSGIFELYRFWDQKPVDLTDVFQI